MSHTALAFLCLLIILVTIGVSWRQNGPLESLPSVVWVGMAVVPFIYQSQYFPESAAADQVVGLAIVTTALAVGDTLASFRGAPERSFGPVPTTLVSRLLVLAVVLLPVLHVVYAHDLPVVRLLLGGEVADGAAGAREQFAKLLPAPELLKLAFNWVIVVFGPILTTIFFRQKRWLPLVAVVLWCAAYAVVSSARLPIILFAVISLLAIAGAGSRLMLSRLILVAAVAVLGAVGMLGVMRGEVLYSSYQMAVVEKGPALNGAAPGGDLPISPGDVARFDAKDVPVPETFGPLDGPLYRTFLGPIEVANRWYYYFPAVSKDWRPVTDLLPLARGEDWSHAANQVARWAYFSRFPARYLESAHAYAALDADAYSFGGLISVGIAGALLLICRLALSWLRTAGMVAEALYYVGVGLLSTLPFQASLQAILVPNGLAIVLAALFAIRMSAYLRNTRQEIVHNG